MGKDLYESMVICWIMRYKGVILTRVLFPVSTKGDRMLKSGTGLGRPRQRRFTARSLQERHTRATAASVLRSTSRSIWPKSSRMLATLSAAAPMLTDRNVTCTRHQNQSDRGEEQRKRRKPGTSNGDTAAQLNELFGSNDECALKKRINDT